MEPSPSQKPQRLSLLSWCIMISTGANVAVTCMIAWFLIGQPEVKVEGSVFVHGKTSEGNAEPLKVQLCDSHRVCADLYPVAGPYDVTFRGLMVVPDNTYSVKP